VAARSIAARGLPEKTEFPESASAGVSNPDQDLDAVALGPRRQLRELAELDLLVRDIVQLARIHVVEMVMPVCRRVVELADRVDHALFHHTALREQVQRVVDRGLRYATAGVAQLVDDLLGRQVLRPFQEDFSHLDTLWRRQDSVLLEHGQDAGMRHWVTPGMENWTEYKPYANTKINAVGQKLNLAGLALNSSGMEALAGMTIRV